MQSHREIADLVADSNYVIVEALLRSIRDLHSNERYIKTREGRWLIHLRSDIGVPSLFGTIHLPDRFCAVYKQHENPLTMFSGNSCELVFIVETTKILTKHILEATTLARYMQSFGIKKNGLQNLPEIALDFEYGRKAKDMAEREKEIWDEEVNKIELYRSLTGSEHKYSLNQDTFLERYEQCRELKKWRGSDALQGFLVPPEMPLITVEDMLEVLPH